MYRSVVGCSTSEQNIEMILDDMSGWPQCRRHVNTHGTTTSDTQKPFDGDRNDGDSNAKAPTCSQTSERATEMDDVSFT